MNGCWNPGCKAGPGNRKSLLHPSSLSLWMAGMTLGLAWSKDHDCGQGWRVAGRWQSLEPGSLCKQQGRPSSGAHLSILCPSIRLLGAPKTGAHPSAALGVLRQASGLTRAFSPLGKPYSEEWTAKWSYLYSLATNVPNTGFFTFIPKPAPQNYQRWEVGALRIIDSNHYPGQK